MNKYFAPPIVLVLSFMSFFTISAAQVVPSSADLSYLLTPNADLHFNHKVITATNKKWVVLDVSINNDLVFDSLVFAYAFTKNLDSPIDDFKVVSLKSYELYETPTNKMYAFEPANNDSKFLILRTLNLMTSNTYSYIINLEKSSSFFITKTDLTIPILQSYVAKEASIKIAKLVATNATYDVRFYPSKFPVALPPMANIKSKSVFNSGDSTFTVTSEKALSTERKGVYSITEKASKNVKSFFRINGSGYPQLSTVHEIIEASIYLFTRKEKEKLGSSENPKKDYDAFWLENTNSPERAGKMISAYFLRVKESNTLFSTYKEGWKTDMGMIYIIFGPPNKVFRSNGSLQWIYKKTYEMPNLSFTFNLIDKNWDTEHFELERNMNYQNTWFRAIDLWRKGRKSL